MITKLRYGHCKQGYHGTALAFLVPGCLCGVCGDGGGPAVFCENHSSNDSD